MRDNKGVMIRFVNIVKRYPELYDTSLESYSSRACTEAAWEKVTEAVKNELNEDSTAEELKMKWKGIRSSFNRFKNKIFSANYKKERGRSKYYLYDTLRFLDPFVKCKHDKNCEVPPKNETAMGEDELWNDDSSDYNANDGNSNNKVKEEGLEGNDMMYPAFHSEELPIYLTNSHNKHREDDTDARKIMLNSIDFKDEDMLFFMSTLPDVKHFTLSEKRKFKIGVLKLIESIEQERDMS